MAGGRYLDSVRIDKLHRGATALFPFFYSLINRDDRFDDGGPDSNINKPRYYPIAAGATRIIPVKLQDDSIFRLHHIRYEVGNLENELGSITGFTDGFFPPSATPQRQSFVQNVNVSIYIQSSGAREIIETVSGRTEFGNNGGMAVTRHPFLCPRSGLITVELTNNLPFTVRVDGSLFGYKVQI